MSFPDGCSHGKTWKEDCDDCEAVSLRSFIANWEPRLEEAKQRLKEIEDAKRKPNRR